MLTQKFSGKYYMIFLDFFSNKNRNVKKKIRKNLYDFLWFCSKNNGSSILIRFLFLSMKPMYIKCIDFHDKNTSRHSHKPHVSSISMHILFLSSKSMYTKCINFHVVNINGFFISIFEINVYQSIDCHKNNNWLFLMLQVLSWFSVSFYSSSFLNFSYGYDVTNTLVILFE